jgi:hypothetical protein
MCVCKYYLHLRTESDWSILVCRWVVDAIVESVMSSFDTDGDDTMDFKDFTKLVRPLLWLLDPVHDAGARLVCACAWHVYT